MDKISLERIGVVGLGYVGLSTAVCFANRGFPVTGVDIDVKKLKAINSGVAPLFERGVESYLRRAISNGEFRATNQFRRLTDAEVVFVAVGTPSLANGGMDLGQVRSAAREVGALLPRMRGYPIVTVKSTVLPGTTRTTVRPILEKTSGLKCGIDFGLCCNPEFLREGSAIQDTDHPDKVVIGADDTKSMKMMLSLFQNFYRSDLPPVVQIGLDSAELVKYANNSFLAMKISYINSIARICEKLRGSDVRLIADALGLDSRIGRKFLEAGPGYGGSCLPKDVKALIRFAAKLGVDGSLFRAVDKVNQGQAERVVSIARRLLREIQGRPISILGLSFKANTDDTRESASLRVIERLLKAGARIVVYDPKALENTRKVFGRKLHYTGSVEECLRGSELCIIMTDWKEFAKLKVEDFERSMKVPRLLDARGIYNPKGFQDIQFAGIGLGK